MYIFWIFCIFLGFFIQNSVTYENDFDLLVFSQQWPISACIQKRRPPSQCNIPHDDWTIHGIWPSRSNQKNHPAKCRPDFTFRVSELNNIRIQLQKKWISVFDKNPEKFWKYEWDKHGTCSVMLNSLNTVEKYFRKALELNERYDIKYMLDRSFIVPGKRYTVTQILNAIKTELGVSPQVTCIRHTDKKQYLQEVRICFDKAVRLIDCRQHMSETNCDLRREVEYP